MIFLGTTFCGGKYTFDYTPTYINNINSILLQNGIFDELFITKNIVYSYTIDIPQTWDFDTILHALFNGNLHGGNVEYTADQVSSIRVKRREKGTYEWITLFDVPINTRDDFTFERIDKYARSEVEYEYALIPVMNLTEGNLNINTIKSTFDGIYIIEKDTSFGTVLDINYGVQRNQESKAITTLGSKYPYVISNGNSNYDAINLSATFIEYDEINKVWKTKREGFDYRKRLTDFFTNGKVKILKMPHTGEIWMVKVNDAITNQSAGHLEKITTAVNFTEVGDVNSSNDLYDNNFINVNIEGS